VILYTAITGGPCPEEGEYNPFAELADKMVFIELASQYEGKEKGVLVLWGGEDISPSLYKHRAIPNSGPEFMSMRDRKEFSLASEAVKMGMPIIGICRGAQFMCAMAGGALYQDVTGHATGRDHGARVAGTGEVFEVNSYHHQMLDVTNTAHRVVAYSDIRLSKHYDGDHDRLPAGWPLVEPEIVEFPEYKCLAIQFHPEWMDFDSRAVQFCLTKAKELL